MLYMVPRVVGKGEGPGLESECSDGQNAGNVRNLSSVYRERVGLRASGVNTCRQTYSDESLVVA